jgi:alkylhydroperoxidase/carboxymuconolactone decarboxylase family protein YurZ
MEERGTRLNSFVRAVAARDWHLFERLVKTAYESGATREELLGAVETARTLGDVSGPVVAHAYATVHNWQWMMLRQPAPADLHPVEIRLEPGTP